MEIKNKIFEDGTSKHISDLKQMDLPIKESYKAIQLIKEIDRLSQYYFETKRKLLENYGNSEDGSQYEIPKENLEDFNKEMNELLDISNNIDIEKIQLNSDMKVTPEFLLALEDFVELKE